MANLGKLDLQTCFDASVEASNLAQALIIGKNGNQKSKIAMSYFEVQDAIFLRLKKDDEEGSDTKDELSKEEQKILDVIQKLCEKKYKTFEGVYRGITGKRLYL